MAAGRLPNPAIVIHFLNVDFLAAPRNPEQKKTPVETGVGT
jgi:hypothetical protein